ncbi:MAG: hypothetical protein COW22_03815, partial [Chloroflexi bacterium CG15_BIG_FIL_POST_REV_8_21_14_020_46_15]
WDKNPSKSPFRKGGLRGIADRVSHELSSLVLCGRLMAEAALLREESRGAHFRTDFPETSSEWQKHIVFQDKHAQ